VRRRGEQGKAYRALLENLSEISCEKDKHFLSWWPWGSVEEKRRGKNTSGEAVMQV
jgi:hypothetical protein